jgi:hypothetical protein
MRRALAAVALCATAAVVSTTVAMAPAGASTPTHAELAAAAVDGPQPAAPGDPVCLDALGPLSGEVCRLYQAFFLRDPDPDGALYWSVQRANRVPLSAAADLFVTSTEFVSTYGALTNAEFVELVYANVLGRDADAAGLTYWIARLQAGLSRGSLMIGFSESDEFVAYTETFPPVPTESMQTLRLYIAFFFRVPDAPGWLHWSAQVANGLPLTAVADEFVKSPEFVSDYGALTDAQFVALVYGNVLEREPDAAGSSYWMSRLQAGLSRGSLMVGFSESPEFLLLTDTTP